MEENLPQAKDAEERKLRNLDALEFPDLVAAIVDFLQPMLAPYEAAIYWRMFRISVIGNGTQFARISTRGLLTGVITSRSGQSTDLSYSSVQAALAGLETKGAIIKAGETTRDGTLYKLMLPEEIAICRERMRSVVPQQIKQPVNEKTDLDYYNVVTNREKIFERDEFKCHYCNKQLTRFTATLDHITPVSRGGDHSFDNLVTACLHCNSRRGNRPVMDAIIAGDKKVD